MPDIAEGVGKVMTSTEVTKHDDMDAAQLKEEGNALFSAGDYSGAVILYSKALKQCPETSTEAATLLKNRAAAYLKLGEHQKVVRDATAGVKGVAECRLKHIVKKSENLIFYFDMARSIMKDSKDLVIGHPVHLN